MKLSTGMITLGAGLFLANRMRNIDVSGLFHLRKFSEKADFRVRHIHGLQIVGGLKGYIKFFLDLEVVNPEDFAVTAENLRIKAFNEHLEYVGESLPVVRKVTVAAHSRAVIPNIEVHVKTSNTLFDYTLPALLEMIKTGSWQHFKFHKTIHLNISLSLNGYAISKKESYQI